MFSFHLSFFPLAGRTFMCFLFSLWYMQIWSKLQIRPSCGNSHGTLRIQSFNICISWYPHSSAFIGIFISTSCTYIVIRTFCWSWDWKTQTAFNVRVSANVFWWWTCWGRGIAHHFRHWASFFFFLTPWGKRIPINWVPSAWDVQFFMRRWSCSSEDMFTWQQSRSDC